MTDKMQYARGECSWYMDKILKLFTPGKKITVMVRSPGKPEEDFLMTSDQVDEIAAMVERSKTR